MAAHLEIKHKDAMEVLIQKQSQIKKYKKQDDKDETVRGTVPIFNMRNKDDKEVFFKKV